MDPRTPLTALFLAPILCAATAAQGLNFARHDYVAGVAPTALGVADFDGDARPDIAVADAVTNRVSILHGLAGGGFGAPVLAGPSADGPRGLVAADFDQDGRADIATTGESSNSILVLWNSGGGVFAPGLPIPVAAGPVQLLSADFDSNGFPDLLASCQPGHSISTVLASGPGSFAPASSDDLGDQVFCTAISDVDADGDLDASAGVEFSWGVRHLLGDGTGALVPGPTGGTDGWEEWVAFGDVGADGLPDLLAPVFDFFDLLVELHKGVGGGALQFTTFLAVAPVFGNPVPRTALALLDADAFADGILIEKLQLRFLTANGTGGLGGPVSPVFPLASQSSDLETADVDLDGLNDVVATVPGIRKVSVFRQVPPAPPTISATTPAAVAVLAPEKQTLLVHGTGFSSLASVKVGGVFPPGGATVLQDDLLSVVLPNPVTTIGTVALEITNAYGTAIFPLPIVAPATPVLYHFSGPGIAGAITLVVGSAPGDVAFLAASPSLVPSSLPGVVDLAIGNGFANFVYLGQTQVAAKGWQIKYVAGPISPSGLLVYFQAAVLPAAGPAFPLIPSNVATGTIL